MSEGEITQAPLGFATHDYPIVVEAGPGQWNYGWAAEPLAATFDGRLWVEIEAQVKRGIVGIGVLDRNGKSFFHEVWLSVADGKQSFKLVTPERHDLGLLIVRNYSDQGSSEVEFQICSIEPAQLAHELYLIYQPGKVASQTIEAQLLRVVPASFVERLHFLSNDAFDHAMSVRTTETGPHTDEYFEGSGGVSEQEATAKRARAKLETATPSKTLIITGIRDPVSYSIAAFFQNLSVYCPWLTYESEVAVAEAGAVLNYYKKRLREVAWRQKPRTAADAVAQQKLSHPGEWFEGEFRLFVGIDIYAARLSDAPFVRFKNNEFDVLLYRYEQLRGSLPSMLQTGGLQALAVPPANVGAEKQSGAIYEEFKRQFKVTGDVRKVLLNNAYTRHFYPDLAPVSTWQAVGDWVIDAGRRLHALGVAVSEYAFKNIGRPRDGA